MRSSSLSFFYCMRVGNIDDIGSIDKLEKVVEETYSILVEVDEIIKQRKGLLSNFRMTVTIFKEYNTKRVKA